MQRQLCVLSIADTYSEPKTLDDLKTPLNQAKLRGAKTVLAVKRVWFPTPGTLPALGGTQLTIRKNTGFVERLDGFKSWLLLV